MSGLVKAKKYDWKDSNMALFGSDTDKQVKKESAETEPAWQGVGQEVGLKIWRIVNFEVKTVDEDEYGQFYNGDSYIVLNTFKEDDSDALQYDVHFWIGKNSTQDEYGTVAYKTVELDTFLDDAAVQHREVQGHESDLFKSYFESGIRTMEGGAASGFKHVEPESYTPRLFLFKTKKGRTTVRQIQMLKSKINSGDVYILDKGMRFIQFNGESCSPFEKSKAMQFMGKLKDERGSSDDVVIDEGQNDSEFKDALGDDDPEDDDSDDEDEQEGDKSLFKLSGDGTFEEVKVNDVTKDDLVSDDVFLLDTPNEVFVWIGKGASTDEKKNGLPRAHEYMKNKAKCSTPLTVMNEGQKSLAFQVAISA